MKTRGIIGALLAGLLAGALGGAPAPRTAGAAQPAPRTFPQTGHTLQGAFLAYWERHGGLAQFGYPLSEPQVEVSPLDGRRYTMHYFERAVFEAHPENAPPYDVLLSQLGALRYRARYPQGAPGQQPNPDAPRAFPATGHSIGGRARQYWERHEGLLTLGYPISDEFRETSDLDGRSYTVQYFERAVLEYHPEQAPPYDVLLTQLGTVRLSIGLAHQLAATLASPPRIYAPRGGDPPAWPADPGDKTVYYSTCGARPAPGVSCSAPMILTTQVAPAAGALEIRFAAGWEQGARRHTWTFRVSGGQATFVQETGDPLPPLPA